MPALVCKHFKHPAPLTHSPIVPPTRKIQPCILMDLRKGTAIVQPSVALVYHLQEPSSVRKFEANGELALYSLPSRWHICACARPAACGARSWGVHRKRLEAGESTSGCVHACRQRDGIFMGAQYLKIRPADTALYCEASHRRTYVKNWSYSSPRLRRCRRRVGVTGMQHMSLASSGHVPVNTGMLPSSQSSFSERGPVPQLPYK